MCQWQRTSFLLRSGRLWFCWASHSPCTLSFPSLVTVSPFLGAHARILTRSTPQPTTRCHPPPASSTHNRARHPTGGYFSFFETSSSLFAQMQEHDEFFERILAYRPTGGIKHRRLVHQENTKSPPLQRFSYPRFGGLVLLPPISGITDI
ncbi:hypothetical protein EI94DRAFT_1723585 [Lactarius quietus]|nr:hypothetical protein EI94DRAFT_1723585 [Lactarius quietus]